MSVKAKWIIIVTVLLLLPAAASTFVLLSPARHWATVPVTICVKSPGHASVTANDPDGGVTATINAINGPNGWNGTSAGTVVHAQTCNTPWALGDRIPTIAFDQLINGACSGSCLAVTFVGYYDCDPTLPDGRCEIVDADVLTRRNRTDRYGGPYYSLSEPCTSGREWNIEAIMVHEVGHVLGIGHTNVAGATMYPSVSSCNSSGATIEADDRAALDALY